MERMLLKEVATGRRFRVVDVNPLLTTLMPIGEKGLAPGAIAIGDMNRDGTADILIGHASAPGSIYFNGGNGTDYQLVRFGDSKGVVYGIALGDLNGDSYLDIVVGRSDARNAVYLNGK